MNRSASDFYPALVRAYRLQPATERPDHPRASKTAGVDLRTCKRAWDVGYPPTRDRERLPPISVLLDPRAAVPAPQLAAYLDDIAAGLAPEPEPPGAATVPAPTPIAATVPGLGPAPSTEAPSAAAPAASSSAAISPAGPAEAAAGLASLIPAPPQPPARRTTVYVGSDAAERKAVDVGRNAAHGVAAIATQILAGLEPYAKTIRTRMAAAAEHATEKDATFALNVLDKTANVVDRMASAIEKLSRVTSVLDGRAQEIVRHETAAPAPSTPAEIAATAKAVLAEVRLWQQEREAEEREASAIEVTPAETTEGKELTHVGA